MFTHVPHLGIVLLVCLLLAPVAQAQDAAPTAQPKKETASEQTIRGLIAQLGDDSFDKREAAQKNLATIGGPALELLRIAAKDSKDLEVRDRAERLIVKIQETGLQKFRSEFYHDFRNKRFPNANFELTGPDAGKRIKPETEGLRVTVPAEKTGKYDAVGVATRLRIQGDFEITAGFEIVAAEPPKLGRGVYFELYLMTNSAKSRGFAFTRYVLPDGREVYECGLKATNQQGNRETLFNGKEVAAKGKSGQLRITRIGPTIMLSVHDDAGEGFRFLYHVDLGTEDVKFLRLGANTGGAPCAVDLRIHDLRVRGADADALRPLGGAKIALSKTPEAKKEAPDEKMIRALITQLGDDSFDRREDAQKRLAAIGTPALELLRKAAKDGTDLETRQRAGQLIELIGQGLFVAKISDKVWGDSVDPDGDCQFRVDGGKLNIKVPGKPHRLGFEVGATNAPRVLRQIEGDFHAEVQVQGGFPPAGRSVVGKYPWFGAGLVIFQDEKNFIRFERAGMVFNPGNTQCYANWELRRDGKHERKGGGDDGLLDETAPAYLKLGRKGNIFTAAYSLDGKRWKELPTIEAAFAKRVSVGVSVSQNTALGYEGIFEGVKITPAPKSD